MVRTLFAFERLRLVLERRHPLVPTREAVARNRLARVGRSAETTRRLQLDLRCLTSPDILSWCPGCACQTPRADSLVNWAGHLDTAWAPEKLLGAPGSREYLFGLPAALLSQSGFSSLAELVNSQQQLSILKMGLVDKPTPSRRQWPERHPGARRRHNAPASTRHAEGSLDQVGYESPTQFSREYARTFGLPPGRDSDRPLVRYVA